MSRLILQRQYWLIPLLLWSSVVALSLGWNLHLIDQHSEENALQQARYISYTVETFRLWNAGHGGVYVSVDKNTPPNPYLDVPHREIPGPEGRLLTMVNPAYMTRKVAELLGQQDGFTVRLSSDRPLNPINQVSAWEGEALEHFGAGEDEYFAVVRQDSGPQFRYMVPLFIKQECLLCHAQQGYQLGELRGGLSVAFDYRPYLAAQSAPFRNTIIIHLMVWLLLAGLTIFGLTRYRRQLLLLEKVKDEQELLIEQRTARLTEEVAEREAAETKLRLFIESSGEGIYGVDTQGRITMSNPAAQQILGYHDPSELLGKSAHRLFHHSHADGSRCDETQCSLVATYQQGIASHGDNEVFWHADGHPLPIEYRSHPLYHDDKLIGAVVTFADITRRKRNETELKMLYQAMEHSPVSVVITDAETNIQYVNRKFTQITGYSTGEVLGENPRILKSQQTPDDTYVQLFDKITHGEEWRGEFLNKKKNGELFWERASISPIIDSDGHISHFVGVKEDITERKRLEGEIWHRAHYDSLTGLANREFFNELLEQGILQAKHRNKQLALLYVDLDGFKEVNDTYGHDSGDILLREVAKRLLAILRENDTVARLGGDEFALILPAIRDLDGVQHIGNKLLQALAQPYPLDNGEQGHVTASIGIAIFPGDGSDTRELLKCADNVMYQAKRKGKNQLVSSAT